MGLPVWLFMLLLPGLAVAGRVAEPEPPSTEFKHKAKLEKRLAKRPEWSDVTVKPARSKDAHGVFSRDARDQKPPSHTVRERQRFESGVRTGVGSDDFKVRSYRSGGVQEASWKGKHRVKFDKGLREIPEWYDADVDDVKSGSPQMSLSSRVIDSERKSYRFKHRVSDGRQARTTADSKEVHPEPVGAALSSRAVDPQLLSDEFKQPGSAAENGQHPTVSLLRHVQYFRHIQNLTFRERLDRARSALRLRSNTTDLLNHVVLDEDLGFFSWSSARTGLSTLKMGKERLSEDTVQTVPILELLRQQLDGLLLKKKPPVAIDVANLSLPITWLHQPDVAKETVTLGAFPNSAGFAQGVYFAQCHGYPTENLDFVFEGSALGFLALRKTEERAHYLMQKIGKTIFIRKALHPSGLYSRHLHRYSSQLERLLIGLPLDSKHPEDQGEHIQAMTLFGKYKVLFSVGAGVMDVFGSTVEVKCDHRSHDELAAQFFSMLSSGSSTAYIGVTQGAKGDHLENLSSEGKTHQESKLVAVDVDAFDDVANQLHQCPTVANWTHNIHTALERIIVHRHAVDEDTVYRLRFDGDTLRVKRASAEYKAFLPPRDVMKLMLSYAAWIETED